jgi:Fe-S oxidoreductase
MYFVTRAVFSHGKEPTTRSKALNNPEQVIAGEQPFSPAALLMDIARRCTECGACVRQCGFLKQHGSPGSIAALFIETASHRQLAYACSLCGLCTVVCPEQLDPCRLFLDIRRQQVSAGAFNPRPYRALLFYERLGMSGLFSWFSLPKGCTTVFFPGCALPGTRPTVTLRMFQHLQGLIPSLGMALTCCTKPSHDLGRIDFFQSHFQIILDRLNHHGVTTVLTACPNCTKIFRQYAPEMTTQTVFTVLAAREVPRAIPGQGMKISVHDPCPLREDQTSQEAIRSLLQGLGYTLRPMRHQRKLTLCCGEGGAVGFVRPDLAQSWTRRRVAEAAGRPLVSTCAGCSAMFASSTQAIHLADLLFPAPQNRPSPPVLSRPPVTYLNRLWLKFRLRYLLDG